MRKIIIPVFILVCVLLSCAPVRPPEIVLKESSALFSNQSSVSIPDLKMALTITRGDKSKSIYMTGRLISLWPDKLRMKLTKANYHLATMILNGHNASIYFPRTNKLLEKDLHEPVLKEGEGIDLLPAILDLSLIFLKGPFPKHPIRGYTCKGLKDGFYKYETKIKGGTLEILIDSNTSYIKKRIYTIINKKKEEWQIEIETVKYERKAGNAFPRKYRVSVTKKNDEKSAEIGLEMFVSRISFNTKVNEKAFIPKWPADALKIDAIPDDPKELFGEIEEETSKD